MFIVTQYRIIIIKCNAEKTKKKKNLRRKQQA